MRDRLVELIKDSLNKHIGKSCMLAENITNDLLENDVIVPPCKVGDTVYYISDNPINLSVQANTIYEATVVRIVTTKYGITLVIQIHNSYGCTEIPDMNDWGKNVFYTREEAQKALGGGVQND